ncbi:limbic system-associated membrane protein-like [Oratosquilla oratoria]|uniref:limbic system-associated membrane protein-like n=1 Tax=Oratosquilla oratoria TaxID=337810 RepID=UPI003F764E39
MGLYVIHTLTHKTSPYSFVLHQVSWFRRRDWHILTTGTFAYTNDQRFSVLHPDGSLDWTLQIKYITRRDNGTYECQLSTGTGVLSHFVNLHVAVPRASILVRGDYHVQAGSTITLVCVVEQSPEPPQYIFWYHNDKMINYDTERGGVKVTMTTGHPAGDTRSQLTISNAQQEDTGNYTCSASNTRPASTSVFVTYGDSLPAIQRRDETSSSTTHSSSSSLSVISPVLSHSLLIPFLLLSYLLSFHNNLYLIHSHMFLSHHRTHQTSPVTRRVR